MYTYLSDVVLQMKRSISLVGDANYKIPVLCVVMYSNSDLFELEASGNISKTSTPQTIAESYFSSIQDDLVSELGAEYIKRFEFNIRAAVDPDASTSSIIMIVGTQIAMLNKKNDLLKKSKKTAVSNTQQQYIEDMKNRMAKKYLNR